MFTGMRYAVPDIPETTDPEYLDGFSPSLAAGGSSDGTMLPDDIRVGLREPPPGDANDHKYNAIRSAEKLARHSVETTVTGWKIRQERPVPGTFPDQIQEKAPTRWTADQSPLGYQFTRPWHIPRNVADALGEDAVLHFSLADHRRTTVILGMKPQGGVGTNTYRGSMRPWDEELIATPQFPTGSVFNGAQSHRAGGNGIWT